LNPSIAWQEARSWENPFPERGEYWNYPTGIVWSPNGKKLLVSGEAGPSGQKYEDYWMLDWQSKQWRYAGGGNEAKWSPDSSQILWTSQQTLEPLGRIHVWVVHLVLVDAESLKQTPITTGTSFTEGFSWCAAR